MYEGRGASGFGNHARTAVRARPLKRPTQARARFTVQAIYDAFVRIWRREGWAGVSTRAVALETGIAIGTLYDYFPSKEALLSGYVRHALEALLERIEREAVRPADLAWRERIERLVRLSCALDVEGLPPFDHEMLMLEARIAELHHHRRAFDELLCAWQRVIAACADLPRPPSAETVTALLVAALGGRRYLLLLAAEGAAAQAWVMQMQRLCCAAIEHPPTKEAER